ncbi:unnamed protein product [Cylindrotheca closterium]|uniref:Uncharacterized protein n=1 Tax=Cylindrotheca closterium TaxID=2856 RepID=A0AAD2JHZ2_9STRA|nr:unnamed protein product [Cylindrotheca closterium]
MDSSAFDTRFPKAWFTASLSTLALPFLTFATALFLRIDEALFTAETWPIICVYLITAAVQVKLTFIVHKLYAQVKLLPIRFLLLCYAIYSLVLVILIGYLPNVIEGQMVMDQFSLYNAQIGVLLFHTSLLALLKSLFFAAWTTKMIQQRINADNQIANKVLTDAIKEDHCKDDIPEETDYVQVL